MKLRWSHALAWLMLSLGSAHAVADTLTATVSGVPAVVPVSPPSPAPSSLIAATINVAHTGAVGGPSYSAVNVSISINMSELQLIPSSTPGWSCSDMMSLIICEGSSLAVGQSSSFTLNFMVRSGSGTSATQIVASPSGSGVSNPVFESGTLGLTITDRTDLALAAPATASVPLGSAGIVQVDVLRNGSDPSQPANLWSNVRVGLNFPSALRYGGATASGWSCPAAAVSPGGSYQCIRGSNSSASAPESIAVSVIGVDAGSVSTLGVQLQHDTEDLTPANNLASTQVSVGALDADLGVQMQAPAVVLNGAAFALDLVIENAGPGAASAVQSDMTLSAGLQVLSVPSGCVLFSAQTYRCTAATLAVNSSVVRNFSVRHAQPLYGPVGATATVSAAENDPVSSNNSTSTLVSVTPAADLSLGLTPASAEVAPGSTFLVQAQVLNQGVDGAAAVQLTFDLPANATLAGTPVPTVAGSPMSCTPNSAQVQCVLSSLPPGQRAAAAIALTAPASGVVAVQASTTASEPDPVSGNNSASSLFTVSTPATLAISKTASSSVVQTSAPFFYRIAVSNEGSQPATGLVVLDAVPPGQAITAVEGGSFNCTRSGQNVDCRLDTLAPGGSSSIVVRVNAPAQPGNAINSARVSSVESQQPELASATVQFVPGGQTEVVDLQLLKLDSVDPVLPGAEFEYELRVTNNGTAAATGFSLEDSLPAGLTLLSIQAPQWTCSGSSTVRCEFVGALAPQQSSSVRLLVRAPQQQTVLNNTATLSVLPGETLVADNTASQSTTVRSGGGGDGSLDLALTGSLSNTAPQAGAEIMVELLGRNKDTSIAAQDVQLCGRTTGAAGALRLLSLSAAGANCSISADGSEVSCRIPVLPAGASLAFTGSARVDASAAVGSSVGLDLQISCGRQDPQPEDNVISLRAVVAAAPVTSADLSVQLGAATDPVPLGGPVDLRAEVRNSGPAAAQSVTLALNAGAGVRIDSASGAGWTCVIGSGSTNCQLAGGLQPQASAVLVLSGTARGPLGTQQVSAQVGSSTTDPNPGNNQAVLSVRIGPAGDRETIEAAFSTAVAMDPIAGDAAPVVADICANPAGELVAQCNALISAAAQGNQQEVVQGLRALFPEEVAAQSLSLSQAAATQFSNVDARLNQLRGGGSGFSLSGLALGVGRQTLPLGMLSGLLDGAQTDPEVGGSGDLISPWGGFINGTLSRGDQRTGDGSRRVVSDFQSHGLTAGVDYRRSARWVLGAALGYADFQSDVTDGGELKTKGFALTGYSAWYPRDRVYLDTRISYAMLDMDLQRRVQFGGAVDRMASGSTDSSQLSIAAASGYHFSHGSWSITPNVSLRYLNNRVDGFTEVGAGANNAIYGDQQFDSLQLSVGLQVNRVISLSNGVITPQFDLSLSRELRDEDLIIEARLAGAAADQIFRVRAEEPDHSFGNVGLGFVYIGANGRQFYMSYRELIGAEGTDRGTLTIGGRFEF